MQLRGARSKGAVERALTAGTAVQCQRQEERGSGDRHERKRVALPGSRRRSMLAVVRDGYSQWNAGEAQRHATNGGRPTWREVARPEATGPWKSEATSGHETENKAICTCETMEHQGVASLFVQIAPAMQLYKFQGGSGCSQNVVACDVPSNMQT
ncbi:hypothetical protein OsI_12301 [Oryza sativa Indica Group]|uniref:Uncharacterized protein n=1 Tax=Oryza sativa subsp. indica TaxID=39946 RepID=B8AKU4_ORYSI|nr:hypothetical protein OsI_12301 [Oryza sativa Indica Group]